MSALPLSTPRLNRLGGTMQNPPHTSPATASELATTRQVVPCHSRAASTTRIEHAITNAERLHERKPRKRNVSQGRRSIC
jgi:hypothetical protein